MTDCLNELVQAAKSCRTCIDVPQGPALPHDPNPIFQVSTQARLCIAGQAAGTRAHASSKPFDDPSGDRLRAWLGIDREHFYNPCELAILPMSFCFPGLDKRGSDLPPRAECAPLWRRRFLECMPQLELILAIGRYAQAWHLADRRQRNLTDTVRKWREYLSAGPIPAVLPLPHPSWRNNAWLKRNPWFENELLPVLREQVAQLIRQSQE